MTASRWKNKADLISYLTKGVIDYELVSNVLYLLVSADSNNQFITTVNLYQIGSEWLYTSGVPETLEPPYYNCPLRLLLKSTCNDKSAVSWREKCQEIADTA